VRKCLLEWCVYFMTSLFEKLINFVWLEDSNTGNVKFKVPKKELNFLIKEKEKYFS